MLTSFILALLLWFVVTTEREYATRIVVPFEISHVAPGYVLEAIPPQELELEVRGKGRALLGLQFIKQNMNLEFRELSKDTVIRLNDYRSQLNVSTQMGIELVDIIRPTTLHLKVDKFSEQRKPVLVQNEIKPMLGYLLMEYQAIPESVYVRGPQSMVDDIRTVKTEMITRREVKYPFQVRCALINPRPSVLNLDPATATVQFEIEQLVERKIYNVPIQIIGVPPELKASAQPSNISLKVKGGEDLITSLSQDQVTAYFDYGKDFEVGRLRYPVEVEAPEGVQIVSASPEIFRLKLERKESTQ